MSFDKLGLSPKILDAIQAAGYTTPTPIQESAIPVALQGRDVLGIAQTGTGKTAGFALPMLQRLETGRARARMPRTLIMEPTRELAAQVAESFELLGKNHKLTVALLIGGVSFDEQNAKLDRGADVLIATPGRLLDHFERGRLLLTGVEILVIDEADRMLDMGFIPDIERICKLLPFTRQTLFFSATMPPEIQRLVSSFLHNPERIEAAPQSTAASTVTQRLVAAPADFAQKRNTLRNLLRAQTGLKNAIIFCNRKRDVAVLDRSLKRHGFNAGALHGDMDQHARMATLDSFRNDSLTLLVASDVAARGLDIPAVSHVINFDVPVNAEDYIHRIGRTGRAGREGTALMLVGPRDGKQLAAIQALVGGDIEWLDGKAPSPDEAEAGKDAAKDKGGARKAAGESANGRTRRSRGKAQSSDAPAAPGRERHKQAETPAPEAEPALAAAGDATHAGTSRPRRQSRREAPEPETSVRETPVREAAFAAAMGGHVPAFLLRPARVERS